MLLMVRIFEVFILLKRGSVTMNSNEKIMNDSKRIVCLDFIKIVAAIFVVILHVNGYTMQVHELSLASTGVKIVYYLMEGIAYIAVHLFVLAGSYLMCTKEYTNLNSVLYIWVTTVLVTITGLVVAVVFGIHPSLKITLQSIFPLSLRAYGYVSSYIVLMLVSPFINMVLRKMNDQQVYYVSTVLVIVNVVFPTIIPFIGWGENYTVLFICLYFVSASVHRLNNKRPNSPKIYRRGVCAWMISTMALIVSPYIISFLSNYLNFLLGKEEYFYNYHNVIVLTESVGLFL